MYLTTKKLHLATGYHPSEGPIVLRPYFSISLPLSVEVVKYEVLDYMHIIARVANLVNRPATLLTLCSRFVQRVHMLEVFYPLVLIFLFFFKAFFLKIIRTKEPLNNPMRIFMYKLCLFSLVVISKSSISS